MKKSKNIWKNIGIAALSTSYIATQVTALTTSTLGQIVKAEKVNQGYTVGDKSKNIRTTRQAIELSENKSKSDKNVKKASQPVGIDDIYTKSRDYGILYHDVDLNFNNKNTNIPTYDNQIVIEFNSKDVIKKNAAGSSVYAGTGALANNIIKLSRVDSITGEEVDIDLSQSDIYGHKCIQFMDDTDPNANRKDKIIINSMSGIYLTNFHINSTYKLSIGNITDLSGNVLSNPQELNFTTGPSPYLSINKSDSDIMNIGSSINAGSLITDIKTDGSYGGFVVDAGGSDPGDGLINISQDTVKIYEYGSNVPIDKDDYTVSESFDNKKILIKPVSNKLEKNKIYSVVISGVTDIEGNPMLNRDSENINEYKFYFQTQEETRPSIAGIHVGRMYNKNDIDYSFDELNNEQKNVSYYYNCLVIEFNDKDVIKKNAAGSSVYTGMGVLPNDLIKLSRIDNNTGKETYVDLTQSDIYGEKGIQFIDDTDPMGNGKDKIVISSMSSFNLVDFAMNSTYKLSIGNITDASGNILSNPQEISFTTGPSPILGINKESSKVNNVGSSINVGSLITDIKTDGSYSGFVVNTGISDQNDGLKNVSQDTVKVYEEGSNTPLGNDCYNVTESWDRKNIIIKPAKDKLKNNTIYSVVINGVTDIEGNPILNRDSNVEKQYRFYFKTIDQVQPSVDSVSLGYTFGPLSNRYFEGAIQIKNGDKGVIGYNCYNNIIIQLNHNDVVKKNALGSSVYAGLGTIPNNLIKLSKIDNRTGKEVQIDLNQKDIFGGNAVQVVDDTERFGNGSDKIVLNLMSSFNLVYFMENTTYKLSIGQITDEAGNTISNPQEITFTNGPSPCLQINKDSSHVNNTGSSISSGLITDIKTDGSYNGFVVDSGSSDSNDGLKNVSSSTVKLYENDGNKPVSADSYTVSTSWNKKKIIIKPVANKLQNNKIYSVVINGVTDIEGNPILNTDNGVNNQYKFYFATEDTIGPTVNQVYCGYDYNNGQDLYGETKINDGDKNVNNNANSLIIEFKDKDVVKKNSSGSSVYAGVGNLPNNLIKLTRIDNETGEEENIDLTKNDLVYHNKLIEVIDDTDINGNGKDKIIVHPTTASGIIGFMPNSVYKLSIGSITDNSGNLMTNSQTINFTTGPAPMLQLDRSASELQNTGSSINVGSLITDIKTDGSYNGFVINVGSNYYTGGLTNVSQDTVKIYDYESGTEVSKDAYTVDESWDDEDIIIKPKANGLEKNKIYYAVINGVTDIAGNPILNTDSDVQNQYRFYFKTEIGENNFKANKSGDQLSKKGDVKESKSIIQNDAPMLKINKEESKIITTSSAINMENLIPDIDTDGSYSGFIVEAEKAVKEFRNVSKSSVKVYEGDNNKALDESSYTVDLSQDKKKIVIKPSANKLNKDTTYYVLIKGITDENGNLISNTDEGNKNQYKFYFKTK
ncbi:Ig-like domain-containing protein [Clostridium felsineum]|uniref:Uncharacterized protein n=1 Tax=Clostridium felsineum TaxID=36839 RepID=A0A1S8L0R3_9CLOT|nr:Ig-like domain-containing protein [Clostridium felsineum]URZ05607.1 hypothetical protein CLROS_009330 [Clostridium felsineum]URZ10646.1 hypothetical protein CROST_013560 [Clostridium felsineum]